MADDPTRDDLGVGAWRNQDPAGSPRAADPPGEARCQIGDSSTPVDRVRRWSREYGGFVAAGALALAVLVCSGTLLSGAGTAWHPAAGVAAGSPPSVPGGRTPVGTPTAAAATRVEQAPKAARAPRASTTRSRSTRSPSAAVKPALLGPADARGLGRMLDGYCGQRYRRSAMLTRPWPDSGATGNWACRRWQAADLMIDMTGACGFRYGAGTVASYLDAKDPYSWRCYRR